MNRLLNAYVKSKQFHHALKVFDEMPRRNTISYNIVICGMMGYSFDCFKRMLLVNEIGFIYPDEITFNGLLRSCIELRSAGVFMGQQTHSFVTKLGFVSNCFVGSALVDMYAKLGLLGDGRRAFDEVVCKDLVLWNVMVSCYASNGLPGEACDLYKMMRFDGVAGDAFTLCSLLSCGFVQTCDLAKQLHCCVVKVSYSEDLMVASALVDMYVKNGGLLEGRRVFDDMRWKNLVTWNIMVVGYGREGDGDEAMKLLRDMLRESVTADELTLASVFSSCGNSPSAKEVAQVHDFTIKCGFEQFPSISNSMVNAYSKCGNLSDAVRCVETTSKPDLITWTSMINAYWTNGQPEQAILVFEKMLSDGVTPDHIAFLSILSACSHWGLLPQGLHYFTLMSNQCHITPNQDHYTCLVDLLGRFGSLEDALILLSSIQPHPNQHTWAAFTKACQIHGRVDLAKLAAKTLQQLEPNESATQTLSSSIYASNKDWSQAAEIQQHTKKTACSYKTPGCSIII